MGTPNPLIKKQKGKSMKNFWLIFICTLTFAIPSQAWLGRAVIIAFDNQTQNYRMLLAKINKTDTTWTDFSAPGQGKKGGEPAAKEAIETQLPGTYKRADLKTILWRRDNKTGDVYHIFLVDELIPGKKLYPKMVGIGDVRWSTSLTDFTNIEQSPDIEYFIKWALNQPEIKKYFEEKSPKTSSSSKSTADFKDALKNGQWPKLGTPETIHFYHAGKPYEEFANTFDSGPVIIDQTTWLSTEHYFQSQKFSDPRRAYRKYLKKVGFGSLQKQVPALLKDHPDEDKYKNNPTLWHGDETQKNLKKSMGKKHTAMLKALIAKFTQDKKLEDLLLKTGDQLIIEDTAQANGFQDSEWGAGDDYKGRNILGQMLMWLRKELRDGKKADEIDPKKFVRVIDPKDYLAVYEELMGKTVPTEKKSANRTEFADFAEALSLVPSMP